jgi:dihydrodipicolinate reductase
MTRVGVFGSRGRMGNEVCRAVESAPDLELVAALDLGDDRAPAEKAQVMVDFTHPDAVMDNLSWCIGNGIHAVVGTTGFTDERLTQLRSTLADHDGVGVLVAPNFSIGAVLMMRFAEQAAPFYESVEIIELHHPGKADAPSGTAALKHAGLPPLAPRPASEGRLTQPFRSCPGPVEHRSTASEYMVSGSADWLRTKRCCSAPRAKH